MPCIVLPIRIQRVVRTPVAIRRVRRQRVVSTLPHRGRRDNRVIHAIVDVLLVILGPEEKEHFVATPVEARVWQENRTVDLESRIEILCLGPRNT